MAALPHIVDPDIDHLIMAGMNDSDPWVRQTTIGAVARLSPELADVRKKWAGKILRSFALS